MKYILFYLPAILLFAAVFPACSHQNNVAVSPGDTTLQHKDSTIITDTIPAGLKDSVPATIRIYAGDGQTGNKSTALFLPLVVQVANKEGYALKGVQVSFTAAANDGQVTPALQYTDGSGSASATWVLGSVPDTAEHATAKVIYKDANLLVMFHALCAQDTFYRFAGTIIMDSVTPPPLVFISSNSFGILNNIPYPFTLDSIYFKPVTNGDQDWVSHAPMTINNVPYGDITYDAHSFALLILDAPVPGFPPISPPQVVGPTWTFRGGISNNIYSGTIQLSDTSTSLPPGYSGMPRTGHFTATVQTIVY